MRQIPAEETLATIDTVLREAFPKTPFTVKISKSRKLGAIATIEWSDGPAQEEVERYARLFTGLPKSRAPRSVFVIDGEECTIELNFALPHRTVTDAFRDRALRGASPSLSAYDEHERVAAYGEAVTAHSVTATTLVLSNPWLMK